MRISSYLKHGEGIWWKNEPEGVRFLDGADDPNVHPLGPQLDHFRNTTLPDVYRKASQDWDTILHNKITLPSPNIRLYDSDGNFQNTRSYFSLQPSFSTGLSQDISVDSTEYLSPLDTQQTPRQQTPLSPLDTQQTPRQQTPLSPLDTQQTTPRQQTSLSPLDTQQTTPRQQTPLSPLDTQQTTPRQQTPMDTQQTVLSSAKISDLMHSTPTQNNVLIPINLFQCHSTGECNSMDMSVNCNIDSLVYEHASDDNQ